MRYFIVTILLASTLYSCKTETDSPAKDDQVEALLSTMTLEEKVGQMTQVTIDMILQNDKLDEIDERKLKAAILEKKVGSILNVKPQERP